METERSTDGHMAGQSGLYMSMASDEGYIFVFRDLDLSLGLLPADHPYNSNDAWNHHLTDEPGRGEFCWEME